MSDLTYVFHKYADGNGGAIPLDCLENIAHVDAEEVNFWEALRNACKHMPLCQRKLYYSDFLAATMGPPDEASVQAVFKRLDSKGSGSIDAKDVQHALKWRFEGVSAEELFDEAVPVTPGNFIMSEPVMTFQKFCSLMQVGDAWHLGAP